MPPKKKSSKRKVTAGKEKSNKRQRAAKDLDYKAIKAFAKTGLFDSDSESLEVPSPSREKESKKKKKEERKLKSRNFSSID